MVALKIDDIRTFTSLLFLKEAFDGFLLKEARIVTFNTFSIDGRTRRGYYTEEELEENNIGEYSLWKNIRPICFSLIKGKRLPESFHIVLKLGGEGVKQMVQPLAGKVRAEDVEGLYLNIKYENRELSCITGMSMNYFTLDKTLAAEWDQAVKNFFRLKEIGFMEE